MKRALRLIVGCLVTLLLAVPLFLWITAADPVVVARGEAGGAAAQFLGSEVSDGPFGGHAKVRFGVAGKPREVSLSRPFWSRDWRVISPGG